MSIVLSRLTYLTDAARVYRVVPRPLQKGFWSIFLLQTVTALLESSTIIVITFFIGSVSSPEALRGGRFFRWLFSLMPEYWVERLQGDRSLACAMCLAVVLFIALKNLMTGITTARTALFAERLGLFVSGETLARYFRKSYYWHLSAASGDVLARLHSRAQLSAMLTAILQFCGYAICCLCMMASLLVFEPLPTLLLAAIFAAVSFAAYRGVKRRIDQAGAALAALAEKEHRSFSAATRGIRELIIHRREDVFLRAITDAASAEMPYRAFLVFAGALPAWLLEVAGFAAILGVMIGLASMGRPMHEIVTSASLLFLSAWRLLPAVSRCMGLAVQIRGIRPTALTCLELLEGFASEECAEKAAPPDGNFRFGKSVALRDATFRYPDAGEDCLHGVTLSLEKGECVGIVGASGSGKSTLALILAGLLEPRTGAMLVDGAELDGGRRAAYRQRVGFVPQNPLLLPGTVAENVALGKWGEEYSLEKVARACEMAAMDFLANDPRGVNIPIGDGGQGLSGGQAQRVSVARALFTDPEVLILDEATSALDQASENAVAGTIHRLRGTLTAIVIAHRLSTVERCDRVIWLRDGMIEAEGTPSEILPRYTGSMRERAAAQ